MTTFAESLDRLWKLQGLDARIIAARQRMTLEQRRIKEQEGKITSARGKAGELESKLKQLQVRHREIEDELSRLDERIRKIEFVAGSEHEVEKHRATIDDLETEGLTLISEIPEQQSRIREAHQSVAKLEAELQVVRQAAEAATALEGAGLQQLQQQRDAIAAEVPEDVMKVFQSLSERHPAASLCWLDSEFCGGCMGKLNMQLVMRAKQRSEFVRCPHCSRVLDPGQ